MLAWAEAQRIRAVPVSAQGLAAFAGLGFWHALERELGRSVVVDCGEDAGLVMAGLRAGCRDLLFTGEADIAARLASMAEQAGTRLRRELAGELLDLLPGEAPAAPDRRTRG